MPKPYTIAFANQKGGVGKTTSCVNVASCAAEKGLRVLLVDSDPQGNSTSGVGVGKRSIEKTTYDVLIDGADPADCVVKTGFKNLSLLPSTLGLAGAEFELFDAEKRERRMRTFLEKCGDDYDLAVIDCPPSLSLLTVNALTAADSVVIPMQCEYYALEGIADLVRSIKMCNRGLNPELGIEGIVMTMYDGRTKLSDQVVTEVRRFFGKKVYKTMIPRNVRLSEAPSHRQPAIAYDKESKGSRAYLHLASEMLKRDEKAAKKEKAGAEESNGEG